MFQNPVESQPRRLDHNEHALLEALLQRKLSGIPAHHLSALTLADLLHKSPRALHLPQIPRDIQLAFFLCNRALINQHGNKPTKDEAKQSSEITRAIWFYRLDPAHQFQRYHDTARWNMAFFAALLCLPSSASPNTPYVRRNTYSSGPCVTPAAQRFMTQYLAAVLEHHNSPTTFSARERFIQLWKSGVHDVFEVHGAGQKKLLKNEMKRLTREWEAELDNAMRRMERKEYDARVAVFVGSLIPGRKDQGLLPPALKLDSALVTPSLSPEAESRMELGTGLVTEEKEFGSNEGDGLVGNELLDSLRVPLGQHGEAGERIISVSDEVTTVLNVRVAIAVLQDKRPSDILPVLMRLFPPQSHW